VDLASAEQVREAGTDLLAAAAAILAEPVD
jgi:hypothetical protein